MNENFFIHLFVKGVGTTRVNVATIAYYHEYKPAQTAVMLTNGQMLTAEDTTAQDIDNRIAEALEKINIEHRVG